jgi:hypothetical protein
VVVTDISWTFPGGKLKQEVTSLTLVNNTAKTIDIPVPTGKLWVLHILKVVNADDVGRTIEVVVYKEAAKTNIIAILISAWPVDPLGTAAYTDTFIWPVADHFYSTNAKSNLTMLLTEGNVISITINAGGASSGGTDADGIVISYLETDAP